jgi:hypothetical protein
MACRNAEDSVKIEVCLVLGISLGVVPKSARAASGIRPTGGAEPDQALVWNVRICRSDAKEDVRVAETARSRVPMPSTGAERPVLGMRVL